MLPHTPDTSIRPSPAPPGDGGIDRRVSYEQLSTLYEATPLPTAGGVSFACIVGLLVWDQSPHALVLGWVLLKAVIAALRCSETGRFNRDASRAQRQRYWELRYSLLMCIDTLSWSAMVPLFIGQLDGLTAALLIAGVAGIASQGVFTTYSHRPIALTYLVTILLPASAWFALLGNREGWAIVGSALVYGAVLAVGARRGAARLAELLRLRFENAAIAEQRHRALVIAEHSNQAKGRFLAAVSHEMRTPLNGILGITELMRESRTAPALREQIDLVHRSAQHLHRVIGDLLDLSRIEFGSMSLTPRAFDPAAALREVADLLTPAAQGRGLALEVDVAADVPAWAMADAGRVRQVLHNLIGNALKFTPSGSVRVRFERAGGDMLRYSVQDTGGGIDVRQQQRIFDAFEQAHEGAQHGGTGLGLTISRHLARAMGGDVTCESTIGQGSTFRFSFRAPEVVHRGVGPPPEQPPPQLSGRVLLVDDNEVNNLVARGMVERLGLQCDVAADGMECLMALQRRSYAAVLMDCQMPRLDGLQATVRWRALETGPRLPIIGVTANATDEDRRACLAAGMDDYLAKPFALAELAAMLQRHLKA